MNTRHVVQRFAFFCSLSALLIPLQSFAASSASGEKIVGEVCSTCHGAGLMGAPKIGDNTAWQARYQKAGSVKVLAETAEHGKGNMPPRGGESSLTDTDLQSAIQFMLGKSGVSY